MAGPARACSIFDPAQSGRPIEALAFDHQQWETTMPFDTIMVLIAVTGMFLTLAVVLGWADRQTGKHAKKS
jgi:hypothetical protein